MLFLLTLVLQCLFVSSSDTLVGYRIRGTDYFQYVSEKKLTLQLINEASEVIDVIRYGQSPQIDYVGDFPSVTELKITRVRQKFIPRFNNLSKIHTIDLDINDILVVSYGLFTSVPVRKISLNNNKISVIEEGSFGIFVSELHLKCNKITKFKTGWFQNPSNINTINLEGNKIEFLEHNTFSNFPNLEIILLSYNGLYAIGDGVFSNRNKFNVISLGFNNLTELQPSLFKEGNVTIRDLRIPYNKLTFLSQEFLSKVQTYWKAWIDGNPWQCACYYYQILRWMTWKEYGEWSRFRDREGEPRCIVAKNDNSNKCIERVNYDLIHEFSDFAAPPPRNRDQFCECVEEGKLSGFILRCYR